MVTLLAFLPAALALNLTPGADMMFVLAQGLKGGARAGMAANLGIALGCFVHVLVAGLGLAALLKAYPMAFEVIRWGGVAYLIWLAFRSWNAGRPQIVQVARSPGLRIFREALVVNLLNPKVALFILAFLPQFVAAARPVLPQFLALGVIICAGGLVVNGAVGIFAGRIGRVLLRSDRAATAMNRVTGGIFAALALRLAIMERTA
ncbi:LysE family translocator [Xinfangfangia sp. D13-10-4-6]|uniref:LysE family translocator n=1 Tax=Pseudogemmobacter hezensis TaxID=2737662 RepID=UPI0015535BB9|nr:LysE family translocator [Pseudogemmobacter hezensis]NPD14663.1 LysE family translocator [Pseudogemmobacter hezensis]